MYKFALIIASLMLTWPCSAQEKSVPPSSTAAGVAAPFGVKDVLDMLGAKMSENLIIDMIHKENLRFALTAQEMVALTKAGATERILRELDPSLAVPRRTDPPATSAAVDPVSVAPAIGKVDGKVDADPNDPDAPHKPGLYLFTEKNGERKLVEITKTVPQSSRQKNTPFVSAVTGAYLYAFVPRAKAGVRTSDHRPIFYFYVGETSQISSAVDSPGQLALVKMDHQTMQGLEGRRMAYAKQPHAFSQPIMGTDPKALRLFKPEQTSAKGFRLVSDVELESGEYCFFFTSSGAYGAKGAAGSSVTLWDFGID